jgi:hypothetical protein
VVFSHKTVEQVDDKCGILGWSVNVPVIGHRRRTRNSYNLSCWW